MSTDPNEKPGMTPEPQWVTKAQALNWLASLNRGNRAISEAQVRLWVDRLNLGRYQTTHQGIAFDEAGLLLDGQTRLEALTRSAQRGFWVQVTTNVPRSAFAVMDAGRNRQAAQLIPGPHATAKGAAARLLATYPKLMPSTQRLETAQIIDLYRAHEVAIEDAASLAHRVYRAAGIQPGVHTALLAVVLSADGPPARLVNAWVDALESGAGLESDDPRLALRNRWSVERARLNSGGREGRTDAAFYLTRAWNAYVEGTPMTKLQLPRGSKVTAENMPEVTR